MTYIQINIHIYIPGELLPLIREEVSVSNLILNWATDLPHKDGILWGRHFQLLDALLGLMDN